MGTQPPDESYDETLRPNVVGPRLKYSLQYIVQVVVVARSSSSVASFAITQSSSLNKIKKVINEQFFLDFNLTDLVRTIRDMALIFELTGTRFSHAFQNAKHLNAPPRPALLNWMPRRSVWRQLWVRVRDGYATGRKTKRGGSKVLALDREVSFVHKDIEGPREMVMKP